MPRWDGVVGKSRPYPGTHEMVDWWSTCCFASFALYGLAQMLASLILAPFRTLRESPVVTCRATERNARILQLCPSLSCFHPTFWAAGPHAQTLLAALVRAPPTVYRREMVALSDGVEIALDWKDDSGMPVDAPIIFCCHGLGE